MSWGHAVSRDLVRWEHLQVGLWEEGGVMMFSGSAVVDWKNTSGFGSEGRPPLVAIYTAHRRGNQSQAIAYSSDRGRTWTKYAENPVLDIGKSDFRDPKVFWHAPTARWIMVVALANDKKITFWASSDLKRWILLSEFGPAGAKDKPNWECPDLFELAVDGDKSRTNWVLEADMGSGSIAGGSGGEYFVGDFDGMTFTAEQPLDAPRWIDYGRDFYAPVSWSDIPSEDGRRIWIGWMNNWETCLQPTSPWRSAMSIPRTVALATIEGRIELVQQPVVELERLRGRQLVADGDRAIAVMNGVLEATAIDAGRVEIDLDVEIGSRGVFGVRVRAGGDQRTTIEYSIGKRELAVDRRRSGDVAFHPRFAGRHGGPLKPDAGRVRIRAFVDESSVEVFGGRGETVITDCVFPAPESRALEFFADDGSVVSARIDLWELRSIWRD